MHRSLLTTDLGMSRPPSRRGYQEAFEFVERTILSNEATMKSVTIKRPLYICIALGIWAIAAYAQTDTAVQRNQLIAEQNTALSVALTEGNRLVRQKAYLEAFQVFTTAINKCMAVVPDHPGMIPLGTNATLALRIDAAEQYNNAVRMLPGPARDTRLKIARAGFARAAEYAAVSATIALKASKHPTYGPSVSKTYLLPALNEQLEAQAFKAQYVDNSVSEQTRQVFLAYLGLEKDTDKTQKARVRLGKLYFDTGEHDKAAAVFATILRESPNHTESLFYGAMSLVAAGGNPGMTTAAGHLKRFLEITPATEPKRKEAAAAFAHLKSEGIVAN